jgi:hypothetical protein
MTDMVCEPRTHGEARNRQVIGITFISRGEG